MTDYTVNISGDRTVTVSGDRDFSKEQSGGTNGAFQIVDANGEDAWPRFGNETAGTLFADTSDATDLADEIVTAANNSPEFTDPVTITGTAQVGETVTAVPGTVTGDPAPSVSYQWYLDGTAIDGATDTTYDPVVGDVGHLLNVEETATNTHGSAVSQLEVQPTVTAAA